MQHLYHHRHRLLIFFSLLGLLGGQYPAVARVPAELQGKWSSHPERREPISGDVDVLTITAADLGFYEVGCAFGKRPVRGQV